jgi:hypothetical protein
MNEQSRWSSSEDGGSRGLNPTQEAELVKGTVYERDGWTGMDPTQEAENVRGLLRGALDYIEELARYEYDACPTEADGTRNEEAAWKAYRESFNSIQSERIQVALHGLNYWVLYTSSELDRAEADLREKRASLEAEANPEKG